MEHRYDPSYERDDRDERDERSRDRDRYRSQSRRGFQPGNHGFQESGYGGQQGQYGQGQYGQGQYGGSSGQYGSSGSDYGYGQGGYDQSYGESGYGQGRQSQYSGFERSRDRDRDRWGGERDYRGESSRSDSSSGYYRPGSGYGARGAYGSDSYGQRWGRSEWEQPRERFGESRWGDEQRGRGESQGFFGDHEGGRGRSFGGYGERGRERPGFFQRLFKRGPKGYQRSDERLREDISERLMYSMEIDSSEVTVNVADGRVTLDGTVPDRYMKHAIEDLVDECPGVQDIDNRVRVQREGSSTSSLSGGSTTTSDAGTSTTSRTGGSTSTGSQSRRPS